LLWQRLDATCVKEMRRPLFALSIAALLLVISPAAALAATDPGLGGAGNFAVLAGTTVTNTGPTWITGQLGVSPGTAVTGFPPGVSGVQHKGDSVALTAKTNLTAAYTNAAAQPCPGTNNFTGVNLGGKSLVPGVYCQTTAPSLTGTLTLNGSGIYIFKIGSTLVTASGARVHLIGGAQPCQVFWQVGSSATIATSTTFVGTIMALTSIAMQTGATLNGRALARNGAVTLDTNRINRTSGCGYGVAAYVAPPAGNVLPAHLGVPAELQGPFPWLLAIGLGAAAGAIVLSVTGRRRRRTN
jgi:ice-binding like protein